MKTDTLVTVLLIDHFWAMFSCSIRTHLDELHIVSTEIWGTF